MLDTIPNCSHTASRALNFRQLASFVQICTRSSGKNPVAAKHVAE